MEPPENEQPPVCSLVCLDIAQFSQQPGEVQFGWRIEFSMLLDRCLEGIAPDHRTISDTSNGAVIAFPLQSEDAFLFAQRLQDEAQKQREFALRTGIHIGPWRMEAGPGGRPGVAGEGVNAAQRAMRFAGANEVLASRAFQEEMLRILPDCAAFFMPFGKQTGKLGREHDLFRMVQPPASQPLPGAPEPEVSAEPPTPAAAPEPPAPDGHDQDAHRDDEMPAPAPVPTLAESEAPAAPVMPRNPRLKIGLLLFLMLLSLIAGVWLWFAQDPGKQEQAPPPETEAAAPEAAPSAVLPGTAAPTGAVPDAPASPDAIEKPGLTEPSVSGKVPAPKPARNRCPNCSCTDLMTKLSLGSALNENERRFLAEHCKK
jgi:hypothetical protein